MLLVLLIALAGSPSADDLSRAKVLYQSGKTHYELGNYSDAIRDFAAGYALSPRPEFLINLGQAYRAAGEKEKAREMFEKYLERAPAKAKERKEVEALITELEAEIAKQAPKPVDDAPRVEQPVVVKTDVVPVPEPLVKKTETPEQPSAAVWAVPLGIGVAVAAGVAIGLAVGFSNSVSCASPPTSLGCVDLRSR